MERKSFQHRGLKLSYLDSGGIGSVLIALHAHWLEAGTFIPLATALGSAWRVISLDQRGHGYSDHARSYTREDYLGDLTALFAHLKISSAVLLGNSLGGVNAYQYAARFPGQVRALIIEDIGVVIADDISFALAWSGYFSSFEKLAERIGPRFLPYLQPSIRSGPEGWWLAFDPAEMLQSQSFVIGDHWQDWLSSKCPALLIRGEASRVTDQHQFEEMASRRQGTELIALPGGHVVHFESPERFAETVHQFLEQLPSET